MSGACPDCLRRAFLLSALAAHIDRIVDRGAGERARDLLALGDADLAAAASGSTANAAAALARAGERALSADERLLSGDCWTICRHDDGWPETLAALGAAEPWALFARGDREWLRSCLTGPAVTVIGARRCGPYGRDVATGIAAELSASGVAVISGLAFGIDTAAHEGALRGGGGTVAVLGAGAERAYPRSRARLYERIVAGGVVISELPPGTPTFRWMFPARNRIMAALGGLTVVVEAAERSGSLITAEMAADIGRPVGAVPGPVNSWRSAGTNRLLADGAHVIRAAADALDCLLGPGFAAAPPSGRALRGAEGAVLDAVADGAGTQDQISRRSGVAAAELAATLTLLELDGYLLSDATGRFRRSDQRAPL